MGKPILFTKAHVKSYTRADGTFVQSHETSKDSAVPDEHNPKLALQGMPTHALSATVKGHEDLNRRAKVELANRGLDSDGKWIGFNQAEKHHGVKTSAGEPDEVGSHFQTFHPKVLSAAAKGKHDFNTHARDELANRGLDSDGKWVGFKAAKDHHGAFQARQAIAELPPRSLEGLRRWASQRARNRLLRHRRAGQRSMASRAVPSPQRSRRRPRRSWTRIRM